MLCRNKCESPLFTTSFSVRHFVFREELYEVDSRDWIKRLDILEGAVPETKSCTWEAKVLKYNTLTNRTFAEVSNGIV